MISIAEIRGWSQLVIGSGELLTKVTIWISIALYLAGAVAFAFSRKSNKWSRAARLGWTIACAGLLGHVVFAFNSYHSWSHEAAYRDTARQTDEVFGVHSGAGLYVNYALLICWVLDVSWWWLGGLDSYRRRPWPLVVGWHAFLVFIIFNAAVIFETGFVRWAGLSVCLGLCIVWWFAIRNASAPRQDALPRAKD